METKFYSVKETAQILNITRAGVYGLVKKGKIPHLRLGDRILIPKKFIDELTTEK